jgi:hypothetical protein
MYESDELGMAIPPRLSGIRTHNVSGDKTLIA